MRKVSRMMETPRVQDRPRYHFQPAANWMNDPNGLIQWKGEYHLFYQYNPHGPLHGTIHWGHAASRDLAHWTHLPIALAPTPGGPDSGGCWSGCAVNHDGIPTVMYTGVTDAPAGARHRESQCIATSNDGLLTWTKYPSNPVIAAPPPGIDTIGFRDPFVWREGQGWACIIGSGFAGVGGAILLYRSRDLVHWDYIGPLCVGDATMTEPVWTGSMWECPQFFPLGDKHVLIFSAWDAGKTHHTVYAIGSYSGDAFTPELFRRLDLGPDYYAPATMADDKDRRLIWGWMREARHRAAIVAAGWAGAMSLPRVLTMGDDDTLRVAPVPELQGLRGTHIQHANIEITPGTPYRLADVYGDSLEMQVQFRNNLDYASEAGIMVRCSAEGEEYTEIVFNRTSHQLTLDRSHASLHDDAYRGVYSGQVDLPEGEPLTLHIFIDRSIIEVYANDRACLSARVYPTRPDSMGVALVASGSAIVVCSVDAWIMAGDGDG